MGIPLGNGDVPVPFLRGASGYFMVEGETGNPRLSFTVELIRKGCDGLVIVVPVMADGKGIFSEGYGIIEPQVPGAPVITVTAAIESRRQDEDVIAVRGPVYAKGTGLLVLSRFLHA